MLFCQTCTLPAPDTARFCARCGSVLPQFPPPSVFPYGRPAPRPDLEGIGGWLIVLAIALILAPLTITREILHTDLRIALSHGTVAAHIVGIVFILKNLVSLIGLILLNYLFYRKRRIFPVAQTVFYGWLLLTVFTLHTIYAAASPHESVRLIDRTVLPPLISAAIWVPYLLLSKRVKATFVR